MKNIPTSFLFVVGVAGLVVGVYFHSIPSSIMGAAYCICAAIMDNNDKGA